MKPRREPKSSPLGDYRRKRPDPHATNEPFGGEVPVAASAGTLEGAYVVHLHDATRRHYDLRLEVGGVLASFAVPNGLSLDPDTKHLAVNTEDHPIEYLEFEDVIPAKQYGAGAMIAWDRGVATWLEGPAEEEIASGKIHVELRGLKLRGRWALVKLKKSEKGNEWIVFKKADEHSSKERILVEELPRSVLSGLTVEELARSKEIGTELTDRARALGASPLHARASGALFDAPRSTLQSVVEGTPPRARTASGKAAKTAARSDDTWLFDPELDGVRVLATRSGDVVSLRTFDAGGSPASVEAFYPEVVRALRSLPVDRLALDGELVAFAPNGRPDRRLLAERVVAIGRGDLHRATTRAPVVFVVKDVLAMGGLDVRPLVLRQRRDLVASLFPSIGFLRAAPSLEGDLEAVLATCATLDVSGVVAKKANATYEGGAAKSPWLFVSTGAPKSSRITVDHAAKAARAALREVSVSNRGKVFWPDEGYTKGDLCDYYASIADVILPHLADRPVILVRYPDGIAGKSFYQWNVPPGMPPWVRTLSVGDESSGDDTPKRGFLLDDRSTLLYIANLACIPVHILACRTPVLTRADFLTIDFDVKQSELRHAVTLARTLKELLDAIGLPGFPKTSGQSGIHVLVPLGSDAPGGHSFQTACALADLLGSLLVKRHPDIATMERVIARRGPRVYVDTGQTGQTRAIVAPYSVRAVAGATVSTPLTWNEVTPELDPRAFTIKTVPKRVKEKGDPMKALLDERPDVTAAITRLSALVTR